MKTCNRCHVEKPGADFHKSASRWDGLNHYCKTCVSAYRKRRTAPKYVLSPEQRRGKSDWHLLHTYGITRAEWEALFVRQGRRCAVCGTPDPKHARGWATDHDHGTGKVRGILCPRCNNGIGLLGDTLCSMRNAFMYLAEAAKQC